MLNPEPLPPSQFFAAGKKVRVLVVDDSAYVRKVVKQMLSRSPSIEVIGTARDGEEALELVEQLQPDVVTTDLNMPQMNGVEFLRQQMARQPLPVIIVSIADESGDMALAALDAGAVDFVHKPTALATERVFEISDELIAKVQAAADLPPQRLTIAHQLPAPVLPIHSLVARRSPTIDIVVLGISTGGPQALNYLIPQLPETFPVPVAVVLHMPVGYTQLFAQRLNDRSVLSVVEAQADEEVRPGMVFIAPAGQHLSFIRTSEHRVVTQLSTFPADTLHRPAVDVLFQSAAQVYGDRVLGIVMTGMGSDGQQGAAWIKAQGGTIYTEAEATCVVYGMPRSVVEAGLSDQTVPLHQMADAILQAV